MHGSSRRRAGFLHVLAAIAVICVAGSAIHAAEVVIKNDSLGPGDLGTIQAGFDVGESGAAWLTSTCNGNVVAVQLFWRSLTGLEPQSIEDAITIFEAGAFPTPGTLLTEVVAPLMTDSVFNEFRYLDENQTIPLSIPVTNGQTFVVSFRFLNDPDQSIGPSLVNDTDGCQNGKNTIDAVGIGWISSCLLGVGGDWVIRAVVDCESGVVGPGSIPNGGDTPGEPMRIGRLGNGDLELTWSPSCSITDDNYEIYEGFLGSYPSHFRKFCTTGGATMTSFSPDNFDRYYLVVPTDGTREGSYGRDSDGAERPRGGNACYSLQAVTCPEPQ